MHCLCLSFFHYAVKVYLAIWGRTGGNFSAVSFAHIAGQLAGNSLTVMNSSREVLTVIGPTLSRLNSVLSEILLRYLQNFWSGSHKMFPQPDFDTEQQNLSQGCANHEVQTVN